MITLEEKRLQELEGRIPVYEATIGELKKKLDEVNAFPKDIAEAKEKIKVFRSDLDHLYNTYNQKINELNGSCAQLKSIITSHESTMQAHQGLIDGLSDVANMLSGKSNECKAQAEKARVDILDVKEKMNRLKDESEGHNRGLNQLTQNINNVQTKANNAQLDATSALNKTVDHDLNLEKHVKSIQSLMDSRIQQGIEIARLMVRLDSLPVQAQTQAKSYDTEIAEIRKDIAVILSAVHTTAIQVPDNSQVNEKIKTMETAIAQVYGLLKKYETR